MYVKWFILPSILFNIAPNKHLIKKTSKLRTILYDGKDTLVVSVRVYDQKIGIPKGQKTVGFWRLQKALNSKR
jgi:hypothetical protein